MSNDTQEVDLKDLKIQALTEELSALQVRNADLRVEVTVLTHQLREAQGSAEQKD